MSDSGKKVGTDTVGLILPMKQTTGKAGLTLDTVWLDIPPVLEAKLFVLDQVVADGNATMRVGLHEGDSRQALGDGRESHRVWIWWHIWNDRIMRCAQRQLFPFISQWLSAKLYLSSLQLSDTKSPENF